MTLAVQTVRQVYNGNGATTTFAIPFAFSANDEVEVILVDTDDVEAAQSYTTHYTISGTNVVMVTAPASGEKLMVRMDKDLEQQIADFSDQVPFLPTTAESALDENTALLQQLNERINRCFIMEKSSTVTNLEMERTLVANSAIVVNATADGLENGPTTTEISNAQTYALAAAASAASSAASASAALASETAAETAETNAETAQAAAEAAQAAAEAAAASVSIGTPVSGETPSGTVDGVNTTFTLAQTPNGLIPFQLYLDGLRETAFTRVGVTITMTTAPETGQTLLADYNY